MARFEIRISGPNFEEVWTDTNERMAVNRFCEVLGQDTTEANPRVPVGSKIVCRNVDEYRDLLQYVIGYG